jgi:hypothetical protein
MCSIDYCDDLVTVIADGHYVAARKPHKCMECGRGISKGERYHTETFKNDGTVTTHKTCAHCMVAREWLMKECGGWVYGAVEEDMSEHADTYYGLPVARLYVAMRNNWKRRDGSLRPIPAIPPTSYDKRKAALEHA